MKIHLIFFILTFLSVNLYAITEEEISKYNITTEFRNANTRNIDSRDIKDIISLINSEDSAVLSSVKAAAPSIEIAIKKTSEMFERGGKIIFIGAGASGRLGVIEAAECPPTFNTAPGRVIAIIAGGKEAVFKSIPGKEDKPEEGAKDILKKVKSGDVVFGITASGVTPYVLGALKAAKAKGAFTNLITSNNIKPEDFIDNIIYLPTGPEVIQGSTRMKAASAAKMTLNIITTSVMINNGKVYKNYMVDLNAAGNKKLKIRAIKIISAITRVSHEKAAKALEQANYKVKTAIVMLEKDISKQEAEIILEENHWKLQNIFRQKEND